jgi:hypothetical protein
MWSARCTAAGRRCSPSSRRMFAPDATTYGKVTNTTQISMKRVSSSAPMKGRFRISRSTTWTAGSAIITAIIARLAQRRMRRTGASARSGAKASAGA